MTKLSTFQICDLIGRTKDLLEVLDDRRSRQRTRRVLAKLYSELLAR